MSVQRIGSNFQVNTTTSGNQTGTGIVALNDGRFFLGWLDASAGRLKGQILDDAGAKVGGEFDIGPGSGGGFVGSLKLQNGGFLIHTEREFVLFDATGAVVNSAIPLLTGHSGYLHLAATANGFVIAASVNGYSDIGIQAYDNGGLKAGAQFTIPSGTFNEFVVKEVVTFGNGGYGLLYDQSATGVMLQRFDSAGNTVGSATRISTSTSDLNFHSQIDAARLPDGRAIVTWSQDGYIHASLLDATGQVLVSDFVVSPDSPSGQLSPHVTVTAGGHLAVAWASGGSVYAAMMDADGSLISSPVVLGSGPTAHWVVFGAALPHGGVMYTWRSTDSVGEGAKMRVITEAGDLASPETLYNDVTSGNQYADAAAVNAQGVAVATFNSFGASGFEVLAQAFQTAPGLAPIGGQVSLPTTTSGNQEGGGVAALNDGQFLTVWVDYPTGHRKAQLLDADGVKIGNEIVLGGGSQTFGWVALLKLDNGNFLAISDTGDAINGDLLSPSGALLKSDLILFEHSGSYTEFAAINGGGFAVATSAPGQSDIQSRLFDHQGNAVGPIFGAATGAIYGSVLKATVGLENGGYLLLYKPPAGGIVAQHFDVNGLQQGAASQISSLTTNIPSDSDMDVKRLNDGTILVAWSQYNPSSGKYEIFQRVLNGDGSPNSSVSMVSEGSIGDNRAPHVFVTSEGKFAVAWYGRGHIHFQMFDGAGNEIGSEQRLSETATAYYRILAAETPDGGLVFTWRGLDGNGEGVRARYIMSNGQLGSDELLVNPSAAGPQIPEHVSVNGDGTVVFVYVDQAGQDGSGWGVFYRAFALYGNEGGTNDAPTGSPTAVLAAGAEDVAFTVSAASLLQGFSDADGDTLSVANLASSSGAVTNNGDGTYTISAPANVNGLVTLTYDVTDGNGGALNGQTRTFTRTPVNDSPTGAPTEVLAAGTEDIAYTVSAASLLQGFSDVDGDTLSVANLASSSGTVTNNGNGTFTISAPANVNGVVTLTYDVTDGNGGTLTGQTRTFTRTPVDDAPTAVTLSNVHSPLSEAASTTTSIKISDIAVSDIDGGNNILSLTGEDASMFVIVGNALFLKARAVLDFETNPELRVTVNVDGVRVGRPVDAFTSISLQVTDVSEMFFGTPNADNLTGTSFGDTINGLAGNDAISGGGCGDHIIGGRGRDIMTGGAGCDTFVFNSIGESAPGASGYINNGGLNPLSGAASRDVITDFTVGVDKIDLSGIDANAKLSGNQSFLFSSGSTFSGVAGQLIAVRFNPAGTANDKTIIYGDVDGNRLADFQIELTGLKVLTAGDFIL